MKEFQQKGSVKKRMYSKTVIVLIFLMILLVARGVYAVYIKERDSASEVARVQNEKEALDARYTTIQQDSEKLKSTDGIEVEIRTKFDVVKDGEGVIVVVDSDAPTIEEDKRGVLKRFWDSVMGVFGGGKKVDNKDVKSGVVQKGQ